ncbi:MAG TPA: hypothetical protein VJ828_11400 [Lacipirellulaceae bacterium]|nr:hypothetical protein [Lacipirellulaceae bacterium]
MNRPSRREFLEDVGRGMLVASLGSAAFEFGMARAIADDASARLTFGSLEPLVTLMQETAPDKLLPLLVEKLKSGAELKSLVTAGALANARAFGGQDYTGYHTFMALVPAYQMSAELSGKRRALPVLKVLHRNSRRLQEQQASHKDVLEHVHPAESTAPPSGESLRDAVRAVDWNGAEQQFAAIAKRPAVDAFNDLQLAVMDEINVHRVVLAWRAWAMLELTGQEYAHSLLRQSLRFCLDSEQFMRDRGSAKSAVREVLPKLLDQYHLLSKPLGNQKADDGQVDELAQLILTGTRDQAAEAAAAALAEGTDPECVGEAISMAANLLVLHDPGRRQEHSTPEKPAGCVHGDSTGVHASDAANAWRNIARVSNARNTAASLIVGAYHTAGQFEYVNKDRYPYTHLLEEIDSKDAAVLLGQTEEAIRGNDQARACAVVERYGQLGLAPRPVFDLLLKYAVSEDGALHAEKYYRTVGEEFAATRPAFRWRQLVALARVTASECGYPAPGFQQACDLLGVA